MKKNSPEFESHIDFKKEEINFIKSKIWRIIIDNFAEKWWKIEIKQNNDKWQWRTWESVKISVINN
jgi:hypothetical protein